MCTHIHLKSFRNADFFVALRNCSTVSEAHDIAPYLRARASSTANLSKITQFPRFSAPLRNENFTADHQLREFNGFKEFTAGDWDFMHDSGGPLSVKDLMGL